MKKNILLITCFFITQFGIAQVLLNEDFNSYASGHLNTDYTGTTVGQGGWVVSRTASTNGNISVTAMVTPETGKGNILDIFKDSTDGFELISLQQAGGVIDGLWNNRNIGNNVLKLEYEVYGSGFYIAEGSIWDGVINFINLRFLATSGHRIEARTIGSVTTNQILQSYTSATFPYNTWHKVEFFYDYTAKKAYYYIPNLNLFRVDNIVSAITNLQDNISLIGSGIKIGSLVKYDNIKLTALPSVPSYILSANEIVSAKFNMYPNPATNVVNITNSENMLVEQVTVYDISGKQLTIQSFNNQIAIQLNVEDLASGTYMLHIQTNAGLAVKKLVKK